MISIVHHFLKPIRQNKTELRLIAGCSSDVVSISNARVELDWNVLHVLSIKSPTFDVVHNVSNRMSSTFCPSPSSRFAAPCRPFTILVDPGSNHFYIFLLQVRGIRTTWIFYRFMFIHELSKSRTIYVITWCVVTDIVYVTLLEAKRSGIKA